MKNFWITHDSDDINEQSATMMKMSSKCYAMLDGQIDPSLERRVFKSPTATQKVHNLNNFAVQSRV